ncbi:oxidoreductase [Luteolibacter sp. LG18]|uniref:oxidoreductase n=1 Tax=Luteolibacter sp. LG18 TaxID=2819286 RepID=UPI002B2CAC6F|nr:oxidoreductase [Luteolibacter sp. LG18]
MNPSDIIEPTARRIVIAGASGLVGGHLLAGLLADPTVVEIHLLARREIPLRHDKIRLHVVDFRDLPELPPVDEAYLALGTTIKVAGSRDAFRAVDLEANLAVAKAAFETGARRIGLVSAMGADKESSVFYNRVKGELEVALRDLPTDATVIVRPSLLLGDRKRLDQPPRLGEALATLVMKPLGFLLPRDYRPVEAGKVARALLAEVPRAMGWRVMGSGELQGY